ncbi:MAG: glucosyltransferase domain-containing protein [Desulfobacterales bacterium]|nr:glucosyltransferase domain-containing protein [Desulfobacterales bacterium]
MNDFNFHLGKKIDNPLPVSASLVLIIFIVYLYQGAAPAFNGDDVIQIQYPEDANTFLAQGRWGYFLIFGKLFQSNPAPVIATFFGSILLVVTGIFACRILKFNRLASVAVLVAVSSISVYYGALFSYDSTRIAYPVANFLAVYGLYLTVTNRRMAGLFLMSLAPAFYPVASELAATVFMALLTVKLTGTGKSFSIQKELLPGVFIIASMILYSLGTRLISKFFGFPVDARTEMDLFAVFHRFPDILSLFCSHSFPVLAPYGPRSPAYQTVYPFGVSLSIFALFLICTAISIYILFSEKRKKYLLLLMMFQLGLIIAPFGLIFASKDAHFPPRALYPFALVHGFYAAFAIEKLMDCRNRCNNSIQRYATRGVLLLAGILLLFNATRINMRAFDEYLASRSEILMANRIFMRIEQTVADNPLFKNEPQWRIAVVCNKETLIGPRGNISSSMHVHWSKERIFHFLSRRITVAGAAEQEAAQKAALNRGEWPASDSVFTMGDLIVVVIHK